jgi:hypothetical protein
VSNGQQERSSVFNGLLLILVGALFLLYRFDPALRIGHLVWRYWPVIIILWGVAKLIDSLAAQRTGEARPPFVTGGELALLVLILLLLVGFGMKEWVQNWFPNADIELSPFNRRFSESQELTPKTIPAGARVTLTTGRGNIAVHTGEGDELRVTVNKSVAASSESSANASMDGVSVVIEQTSNGTNVHPVNQGNAEGRPSIDLDIEIPKKVDVAANSGRGDISISGIAGAISAATQNGNVQVHDAGSDVNADVEMGNVHVTNVPGNVRITGRGNEIEVADVAGNATLDGEFYGPVRVRNVAKTTHYISQKTDLTLVHVTGRMELDSGQIDISDVAGSVKLTARNKDIDVENVAGRLSISNSDGAVKVRYATPPREDMTIVNESGEVDVTVPARSLFDISAVSHSGEIQSGFSGPSLKIENSKDGARLVGTTGGHGTKITIATSYGTIFLRKSS